MILTRGPAVALGGQTDFVRSNCCRHLCWQRLRHRQELGPGSGPGPGLCCRKRGERQATKAQAAGQAAEELTIEPLELPLRMNNVPHTREMRNFFYDEVASAVKLALAGGESRISVRCTIPETNPEMDVYRIGTLLELTRELAFSLIQDGQCTKVSVQQSLGKGVFQGLPLSLSGARRILEAMDWGDYTDFVRFGQVGADQIEPDCQTYIIIAPQNVVGNTIITELTNMVEEAERQKKQLIILNPVLKDVPSAGGVMGIRGRKERMEFVNSFVVAYHFRLLYYTGTYFPIMGALRYAYGNKWQVYKRVALGNEDEEYKLVGSFVKMPNGSKITTVIQNAVTEKKRKNRWR